MSLESDIECFIFGTKKFYSVLFSILHVTSTLRAFSIYLIKLKETTSDEVSNNLFIKLILHTHVDEWFSHSGSHEIKIFTWNYSLFIILNLTSFFSASKLKKQPQQCQLLLEPVKLVDSTKVNLTKSQIKHLHFSIILSKNLRKLIYCVIVFNSIFDVFYSIEEYKNVTINCLFSLFFTLLDTFNFWMLNSTLFLLIYFNCHFMNDKISKFVAQSSVQPFESNVEHLVSLATQIRNLDSALEYIVGPYLITILTLSSSMIYSYFTIFSMRFVIIGSLLFFFVNIFAFLTIKSLVSVHSTFMNAFTSLMKEYEVEKPRLSFNQVFKYNYVLNNCKFNNSLTFLKTHAITEDFFRKASFWLFINTIRMSK